MKTAIYIEDGLTQLVLTPETDFEKGVIGKIDRGKQGVGLHKGSFYYWQGGWVREGSDDNSLIIVMEIGEGK